MDESRICALHDTAVYHYRKAPIDNDITLEKWGLFLGFASNNDVSKLSLYTTIIFGSFMNLIATNNKIINKLSEERNDPKFSSLVMGIE